MCSILLSHREQQERYGEIIIEDLFSKVFSLPGGGFGLPINYRKRLPGHGAMSCPGDLYNKKTTRKITSFDICIQITET